MRPFLHVIAVFVLLPRVALAVNLPPVVDAVVFSPTPVAAGAAVTVTCTAHDDSTVSRVQLTVTAGLLAGGVTQADAPITQAQTVSGALTWTAPAPGTYSVRCMVWDDGVGSTFGSKMGFVDQPVIVVVPAGASPVIDLLASVESTLIVGQSTTLLGAAHDPDGGELTWAWSTSGGVLAITGTHGTWTAPGLAGAFTVTLMVTNGTGQSTTANLMLTVVAKTYEGELGAVTASPRRVSVDRGGRLAVADGTTGLLTLLTPNGGTLGVTELPAPVIAVTWCWGGLVAATSANQLYRLDDQGRSLGELVLGGESLSWASGLACDDTQGLLYLAEKQASRLRAVREDGSVAMSLTSAGSQPLAAPVDVTVDHAAQLVWVLLESSQSGSQAHAFSLSGAYVRSAVDFGSGAGQIIRGAGIAAGAEGRLFIADAFQGTVEAFDGTGVPLGPVGRFGSGRGELLQPSGVAVLSSGDVVIANTGAGRLDRFGTGAPLPTCTADADCDGLPDAWELAHGFNPHDSRDALADVDGDGLTNLDELAYGTDPRRQDTDGDGYGDGEELASGFNPLDPLDHHPLLMAGAPTVSSPGLVTLGSTLRGRGSCSVSWVQVTGPAVVLRDPTAAAPSFVGREAGRYLFLGTPTCRGVTGVATEVEATVREVAPRANAGRLTVVPTGESLALDGRFSSDANGGALSYEWDQLLGPPRLSTTTAPSLAVRVHGAGLYSFQLTARDAAGLTATDEAYVLAVTPGLQAPTVMPETPVFARTGEPVTLDASQSQGRPGVSLRYVWTQTAGSRVGLDTTDALRPTFVPPAPGRYAFEVSALDGSVASPPETVEVFVAEVNQPLPVAIVSARLSGPVGEPMGLDGSASRAGGGGALTYRWRQLSGPAAGLTAGDQRTAVVVPFEAGSFLFELTVLEGGAQSVPAFVRLDADVPGSVRPVAVTDGPAVGTVGSEVLLDGSASTGSGSAPLRYRWTQVGGPWVALDDPTGAQAEFKPNVPGLYTFELEVDEAGVRSATTPMGVLVFPAPSRTGGNPR